MGVHNVNTSKEFHDALEKNSLVVVDCFATWCGPCKAIAPKLVQLSDKEEYKNAHFIKIDVDEIPELSAELGIRAMPTFLFFKNGEKVDEVVGAAPQKLEAGIKSLVA